jgi:hypothetical protein
MVDQIADVKNGESPEKKDVSDILTECPSYFFNLLYWQKIPSTKHRVGHIRAKGGFVGSYVAIFKTMMSLEGEILQWKNL